MNKPLSNAFIAVFVAVMLLCGATVAATLFHQAALTEQITQVQANLTAVQGRLRKQEAEYAQYQAELPAVQAELDALQPQAGAAYEQEQALRQQRKDLRAENSALADELAVLQSQVDEAGVKAEQSLQALDHLEEALENIRDLHGLYE